jgi:predicted helicase
VEYLTPHQQLSRCNLQFLLFALHLVWLIRSFRHANKGLITNARCLTEGIDVPAVDMVAFIDPRHSRVDIAQATGRAMRKPSGSDKTTGYVVIPLFLERQKGEALDRALQRSDFDNVADILNAMQEQDEDLVAPRTGRQLFFWTPAR